jgi:hypothetical protein
MSEVPDEIEDLGIQRCCQQMAERGAARSERRGMSGPCVRFAVALNISDHAHTDPPEHGEEGLPIHSNTFFGWRGLVKW